MDRKIYFISILLIIFLFVSMLGCAPTSVETQQSDEPEPTKEEVALVDEPTEAESVTSQEETDLEEPTEEEVPVEKKVIRYVQLDKRPSDVDGINAMKEAFEKLNPDIEVEIEFSSWDGGREKYITQAQAGDPPDVAQIAWGWVGEFGTTGLIENLHENIVNSEHYDSLLPLAVDAAKVEGEVWAAPWFAGLDMLYYNIAVFEEAGVSAPPETWDDLLEMAPKLTNAPERYAYGWGAGGDIGTLMTLNLAKQYGGSWIDENGNYTVNAEPWIKAIELQQEFILNRDDVSPPTTLTDDYVSRAENFERGYTVMYTAGSWDLKLFEDMAAEAGEMVVGIAPLPFPECDGCGPATFGNGNHWVIFKGSQEKEASWKWIEFMMSPEGQEIWTKHTIFLPVNMEVIKGDFVQGDPYLKIVADAISSAWIPEPTPEIIDWQFNFGRAILQDALLGNLSAEDAAAKMQEELDAKKAARE
jgi:multiple sugar transport system substrate-binding protein